MRAESLAEQIPVVTRATTGAEAARIIGEFRLNGLVVADDHGVPIAVIPGSQVLGLVLPQYLRDDATLAHVFDEVGADELCAKLNSTTVGALIDSQRLTASAPPAVRPEDTIIEVASAMASQRIPLLIVIDDAGGYLGAITLSRAVAAVAALAGQDSPLIRHRLERDLVHRADDLAAQLDPAPGTEQR